MKYNLMTVINSDYFDFGKLFVNSLYDRIDLANIHKLYIYDTGLAERDRKYLSVFPQMEVIPTQLNTKHLLLHDEDWRKNVYSKTAFLLQVIEKDALPTVMIDSDCLFLSNFIDLINPDYDFIACRREEKDAFSEYIASFFVINSMAKAEEFIKDWREEMFFGTENHKESPALSRLINKGKYNVGFLPEDLVSYTGTKINEATRIAHLKSAIELKTVEQRINQPHLKMYIEKYLTPNPIVAAEMDWEADPVCSKNVTSDETKEPINPCLRNISPQKRALLLKRLRKT